MSRPCIPKASCRDVELQRLACHTARRLGAIGHHEASGGVDCQKKIGSSGGPLPVRAVDRDDVGSGICECGDIFAKGRDPHRTAGKIALDDADDHKGHSSTLNIFGNMEQVPIPFSAMYTTGAECYPSGVDCVTSCA